MFPKGAITLVVLTYAICVAYIYHIETRVNPMGVTKEIIKEGNGPTPTKGATVTVHCTGYGKDRDLSKKFWSTKDPGQQPFQFQVGLGSVIRGWDEGVMNMALGEVARLTCSPDYAYGSRGFAAWGIQPDSVLVFEIEVLQIQ
ncbi:peptidyl-prolyl cis-trans isomerase FKBP12-like [Thraustotheca clavata]|uniref:peptidylprolyl isomerase n=1 Tax=Thraustotheca clavata TaxID=74557 RepID=A0A1W0AA17_9STRA|nr:peptidyl-prolyl cis-trans isomerase FKBP12-like [Thraustotheca clavata]